MPKQYLLQVNSPAGCGLVTSQGHLGASGRSETTIGCALLRTDISHRVCEPSATQVLDSDSAAGRSSTGSEDMLEIWRKPPSPFKRSKMLAFAHPRQPVSPATIFTKAWVRVPACKGATFAKVHAQKVQSLMPCNMQTMRVCEHQAQHQAQSVIHLEP